MGLSAETLCLLQGAAPVPLGVGSLGPRPVGASFFLSEGPRTSEKSETNGFSQLLWVRIAEPKSNRERLSHTTMVVPVKRSRTPPLRPGF